MHMLCANSMPSSDKGQGMDVYLSLLLCESFILLFSSAITHFSPNHRIEMRA